MGAVFADSAVSMLVMKLCQDLEWVAYDRCSKCYPAILRGWPGWDFERLVLSRDRDDPPGTKTKVAFAIKVLHGEDVADFPLSIVGTKVDSGHDLMNIYVFMTEQEYNDDLPGQSALSSNPSLRTASLTNEEGLSKVSGVVFKVSKPEEVYLAFKYRQLRLSSGKHVTRSDNIVTPELMLQEDQAAVSFTWLAKSINKQRPADMLALLADREETGFPIHAAGMRHAD